MLLPNTSIVSISCVPGDRWVFVQDVTGAIRAAHFSSSTLKWNTESQQFNFTPVKVGTALGASCMNLTNDSDDKAMGLPGSYVGTVECDCLKVKAANPLQSRSV